MGLLFGCASPQSETTQDQNADRAPLDDALFVDRAADVGLDFVHFNGMSGKRYFVELVGAGGARESGVEAPRWSISASFVDIDRDRLARPLRRQLRELQPRHA